MKKPWPALLKIQERTFRINQLTGKESLSRPFYFLLSFFCEEKNKHQGYLGQHATLIFIEDRAITGIITCVHFHKFTQHHGAEIQLHFHGLLALLSHHMIPGCYLYQNTQELAELLITQQTPLDATHLKWMLQHEAVMKPQRKQWPRENSLDFLHRTLKEDAVFYWHPQKSLVYFSDNTKSMYQSPFCFGYDPLNLLQKTLLSLTLHQDHQGYYFTARTNEITFFPGLILKLSPLSCFPKHEGQYYIQKIYHEGKFPHYINTVTLYPLTTFPSSPETPITRPDYILGRVTAPHKHIAQYHFDQRKASAKGITHRHLSNENSLNNTGWVEAHDASSFVLLKTRLEDIPIIVGGLHHAENPSYIQSHNNTHYRWNTHHQCHYHIDPKFLKINLQEKCEFSFSTNGIATYQKSGRVSFHSQKIEHSVGRHFMTTVSSKAIIQGRRVLLLKGKHSALWQSEQRISLTSHHKTAFKSPQIAIRSHRFTSQSTNSTTIKSASIAFQSAKGSVGIQGKKIYICSHSEMALKGGKSQCLLLPSGTIILKGIPYVFASPLLRNTKILPLSASPFFSPVSALPPLKHIPLKTPLQYSTLHSAFSIIQCHFIDKGNRMNPKEVPALFNLFSKMKVQLKFPNNTAYFLFTSEHLTLDIPVSCLEKFSYFDLHFFYDRKELPLIHRLNKQSISPSNHIRITRDQWIHSNQTLCNRRVTYHLFFEFIEPLMVMNFRMDAWHHFNKLTQKEKHLYDSHQSYFLEEDPPQDASMDFEDWMHRIIHANGSHITLFIHGYGLGCGHPSPSLAKMTEATQAYQWFLSIEHYFNQAAGLPQNNYENYTRMLHILWQGNPKYPVDYYAATRWTSFPAKKCAKLISTLQQHNIKITLVAHSLGGQVLVETLQRLQQPVEQAIFWQAAIPYDALDYPRGAKQISVLYSSHDNVLSALPDEDNAIRWRHRLLQDCAALMVDHKTNPSSSYLLDKRDDPTTGLAYAFLIDVIHYLDLYITTPLHFQNRIESVYHLANLFKEPLTYFLTTPDHHAIPFFTQWRSRYSTLVLFINRRSVEVLIPDNFRTLKKLLLKHYGSLYAWIKSQFYEAKPGAMHILHPYQSLLKTLFVETENATLLHLRKRYPTLFENPEDFLTIILLVFITKDASPPPALGAVGPKVAHQKVFCLDQGSTLPSHTAMQFPSKKLFDEIYRGMLFSKKPGAMVQFGKLY